MDIFNLEPIKELLKKINSSSEFEVIFNKNNPMTINKFIDILKYITLLSKNNKFKLVKETSLDIGYTNFTNNDILNYRITVSNIDNINKIINNVKLRKNHVIFSLLVNYILNDYKDISIMKKTKLDKNIVDIDNYDIRVRLSDESDVSKDELQVLLNLEENERHNIIFRYKQRISIVLSSDNDHELKIDLTQIKQSKNLNDIMKSYDRYELEMDLSVFGKYDVKKIIKIMSEHIEKLYMNIIGSNIIITTDEKKVILDKYKELVYNDKDNINKDLAGMQVISLEIQYLVDLVPTKYCLTDKADGERYFLFISDGKVYLIANNLNIINTGLQVDKKYDNTLIDGELIYVSKFKKFAFLGFDILFDKGVDVRDIIKMSERYKKLGDNMQNIFGSKLTNDQYVGDFDLDKIGKHIIKQVNNYIEDLNYSLKNDKSLFVIKYKFYAFPLGGNNCEIFNYSAKMWDLYTKNSECPYILDGLIYAPLEQKYTRNLKETKYRNLKWKPKEKNSIDFYIEFEKDNKGEIINAFDDSLSKDISEKINLTEQSLVDVSNIKSTGKVYRIINLFVGKIKNGIEYPVLFHKDKNGHIAHLYLQDNEARDIEGNVIQDKTVVELSYNLDPSVPETDRWIPLRTRFDKTEMVNKYKKKYGNNEEIADKVWRSILMPIDISDIQILGDIAKHENHITTMRGKIDVKLIETARSEDIYYQLKTDLAQPQRNFHNWIKSALIYNYCSKDLTGNKLTALDIGIGRGGDIMKYYSAKIGELVGIDVDSNGIFSATDGAYSRYNNFKRKFPGFAKMTFLVADGGAKLNLEDQIKAIGSMDDKNKQLLKEIFGEKDNDKSMKFDIISSQFVLHYMFKDDVTFDNLCKNINKLLKPGGYLFFTTMDGDLVHEELKKNNGKIESFYSNKEGTKNKFFHVIGKYDINDSIDKTGLAVDFYNSSFQEEGNSMIEYLITNKFVVESFKEKCGLELVETENFQNIYNSFKSFFTNTAKYEENIKTRAYFEGISKFYDLNDEVNKASFELSRLNRLYVFQKRLLVDESKKLPKKVMKRNSKK
jgi:SAM-dependent methyltransferase